MKNKMDVLVTNLNILRSTNFSKLIARQSFRQMGEFIVFYLVIIVDKITGEIIAVNRKPIPMDRDNVMTLTLDYKQKSESAELACDPNVMSDLSESAKEILTQSLAQF